ncbi:MAG: cation diffusion facilitator family transporter [Candidatus Thorarchaeota archaeon]
MRRQREFKKSPFYQFIHKLPGSARFAILSLADGPKTIPELEEELERAHLRIGVGATPRKRPLPSWGVGGMSPEQRAAEIEIGLKKGLEAGFIIIKGAKNDQNVYALTDECMASAKIHLEHLERFGQHVQQLVSPKGAIIASFMIHVLLGLLKIAIALLSGSVALLADGIDSAIDALSAIVVAITAKFRKEALGAVILLLLMVTSALTILYQSVNKLLTPKELDDPLLAGAIALLSTVLCLGLLYFQQYIGSKEQNMAILTQAQDSKNHVLVGLMVLVSVVANEFGWFFMDALVGLIIGVLILRATVELANDLMKQSAGEEVDWERYALGGVVGTYNKLRIRQTANWLLTSCLQAPMTEEDLKNGYMDKFGAEVPMFLKNLGFGPDKNLDRRFGEGMDFLLKKSLVEQTPTGITVTANGKNYYKKHLLKESPQ